MTNCYPHQYIERETSRVRNEPLIADQTVNTIYSSVRERAPVLYNLVTSARMSGLLGYLMYDFPPGLRASSSAKIMAELDIDRRECLDSPDAFDSVRKIFERKIRYWQCRPLPGENDRVASPADSKMLAGSLTEHSALFIKEKFFRYEELLGPEKTDWLTAFEGGDFAVFRLTPEKYHYNHCPVSGRVVDIYEIAGQYHSCNPGAVVAAVTPFSKNKRVVTIIDTDVEGGTGVGLVAMIEVVALMIGGIVQCYSEHRYDEPQPVVPGMFIRRGRPKSLYRPGSSVDVLLFQREKITFSGDILANLHRSDARSRYLAGFRRPLVETEVMVRAPIAKRWRS